MFCNRKDNFAMAVVLPAQGPPVMTMRWTRGGPSLSDEAFQVVRFWSVSSSQRLDWWSAASVAQGATCRNWSAARHIVIGAVAAAACSGGVQRRAVQLGKLSLNAALLQRGVVQRAAVRWGS